MNSAERFAADAGPLAEFGRVEAETVIAEARAAARAAVVHELRMALEDALRREVEARLAAQDARTERDVSRGQAEPTSGPASRTPDPASAGDIGWYVFGVTEGDPGDVKGWPGIDHSGDTVGIVALGLVAVACPVALEQFDEEEFRAHVDDVEWLEAKVRAHELVLERMLDVGPTLPMRFGSIYRSVEDVAGMLHRHSDTLEAGLDRVRGREEWSVRARVDRSAFKQWVLQRIPLVEPSGEDRGEGRAYLAERARARTVSDAMEDEASRISVRVERALADFAVETARGDATARRGADGMFQLALLVERSDAREFLRAAARLQDELESRGVALDVTGPWPPASFTSMELAVEAGS